MVASIFDRVIAGKGLMEITKELNSMGIAGPTGKGWSKTSLRKMLGNEVYTGVIVWGNDSKRGLTPVRAGNACPKVVDADTFRKAQALLAERAFTRQHPRRVSSQYLLSGLARCGHCGKALIGLEAKSGEYAYYVCGTLTKKGSGSCSSRYLNSRKLEGLVVDKIKERILTQENLTRLAEYVGKEMERDSEVYLKELQSVENEIADATRRLEKLYDAIEIGKVMLDDLGPRIHDLRERRQKLETRKEELKTLMTDQDTGNTGKGRD